MDDVGLDKIFNELYNELSFLEADFEKALAEFENDLNSQEKESSPKCFLPENEAEKLAKCLEKQQEYVVKILNGYTCYCN